MEQTEGTKHFFLGTFERGYNATPVPCYLLLCPGAPVTVRSQQVRALNLAWALQSQLPGTTVAVIGGGAAGMTFAWAAARLGSKVTIYERHKLMHLQTGSFHRPLHPEIFMWPHPNAYRNVTHMPFLRWAVGTADEVAAQLRSQFYRDHERLDISLKEGVSAFLAPDGKVHADGTVTSPDIIIVATGFGVEWNPFHLQNNSYWRSDPLDQSFVRQETPRILVVGAGDGGLIEIMRACLECTAQGAFLDKILSISLKHPPLREKLEKLEDAGLFRAVGRGKELYAELEAIAAQNASAIREIDDVLGSYRRKSVNVLWLMRKPHPFDDFSLPINRLIVFRLLARAHDFGLTYEGGVELEHVLPRTSGGFIALYRRIQSDVHGGRVWGEFDDVLVRWGAERREGIHRVVLDLCADPSWHAKLKDFYSDSSGRTHENCHIPRWPEGWLPWEKGHPSGPQLKAELIDAYELLSGRMVFRIRIWVDGLGRHLTVRYDLHAEELNWPISKYGIGDDHEQWLNTSNDHIVRVRTSDGLEWNSPATTICDALRANNAELCGEVAVTLANGHEGVPISVKDAVRRMEAVAKEWRTGHFAT